MAILPKMGRVAIAQAIIQQPMHFAWGLGDPSWGETPPPENPLATGLVNEIGRRVPLWARFVVPDPDGIIETEEAGNFSESQVPTHQIVVRTKFDFADAEDTTVREIALFVGGTIKPGLPLGQMYFTADQIETPGTLLQLEHRKPIYRSRSTRELFDFLITF